MTTITWTIAQLDRQTETGGVVTAHWRVEAVDGDYSSSAYGAAGFTPDPTAPDFKPFEELTEADVLSWVWGSVDKAATETALKGLIEDQKFPSVVSGLPWATE
jgi:hypothetical protein